MIVTNIEIKDDKTFLSVEIARSLILCRVSYPFTHFHILPHIQYYNFVLYKLYHSLQQDTVVLWSKSSTLDGKVEGSNPTTANFSFEVDDLDVGRKKRRWKREQVRPRTTIEIGLDPKIFNVNKKGIDSKDVD